MIVRQTGREHDTPHSNTHLQIVSWTKQTLVSMLMETPFWVAPSFQESSLDKPDQ